MLRGALPAAAALLLVTSPVQAQEREGRHGVQDEMDHADHGPDHDMWTASVGGGWRLVGMGQLFPVVTFGALGEEGSPLHATEAYLTQPAVMADLESPGSTLVLRTTLNFEGLTLGDGELTYGGWGEGFLDKRHPHTLLHELMLSVVGRDILGGEGSLSAGKGFAPYGTDDPMARPGLKYPTNHHLSQVLERWTVNGVYLRDGWSVEAGVFGGAEPEGPYDLSNIESFGDSWSARVAKRWGGGRGPAATWEASTSLASVVEEHHGEEETTALWNIALRHDGSHGVGDLYGLAEFSRSAPEQGDGHWSALVESRLEAGPGGRHQPWLRVEYATRPEYAREGAPGSQGFFRYHHGDESVGATRWLITDLGYGLAVTRGAVGVRPFVNVQLHHVERERGPGTLDPGPLFGTDTFWSVSVGARIFLGGGPMRMGSYGVLDPMAGMGGEAGMDGMDGMGGT